MRTCLLFLAGLTAQLGLAGEFTVIDKAKIFSDQAVVEAKDAWKKQPETLPNVQVLTEASVPSDDYERLTKGSPEERGQYFKNWALKVSQKNPVRGVLVLICMSPPHMRVHVSEDSRQGFSDSHLNRLQSHLLPLLKGKKYDQALIDVATFAERTPIGQMKTISPVNDPQGMEPQKQGEAWGGWMTGLLIIGGILLFFGLVSGLSSMGSGGGFMGGLLGGFAGMWLYDSLFNSSAHGGEGSQSDNDSGNDTAGDGDAGGDFGGGDFGGGDGGGDF